MTTKTRRKLPQPDDPVREPVINSPFETPQWRWQLDTSTKAYAPAPARAQGVPEHPAGRRLQETARQTVILRRNGS